MAGGWNAADAKSRLALFVIAMGVAVAIEAAVGGAQAAGLDQPFAELCAGAVKADVEVVAGDPELVRNVNAG